MPDQTESYNKLCETFLQALSKQQMSTEASLGAKEFQIVQLKEKYNTKVLKRKHREEFAAVSEDIRTLEAVLEKVRTDIKAESSAALAFAKSQYVSELKEQAQHNAAALTTALHQSESTTLKLVDEFKSSNLTTSAAFLEAIEKRDQIALAAQQQLTAAYMKDSNEQRAAAKEDRQMLMRALDTVSTTVTTLSSEYARVRRFETFCSCSSYFISYAVQERSSSIAFGGR